MVFLTPQEGFQEICPVWSDLKPYTCHTQTPTPARSQCPWLPSHTLLSSAEQRSVPQSMLPFLSSGPLSEKYLHLPASLLLLFLFFRSLPHIKSRSLSGLWDLIAVVVPITYTSPHSLANSIKFHSWCFRFWCYIFSPICPNKVRFHLSFFFWNSLFQVVSFMLSLNSHFKDPDFVRDRNLHCEPGSPCPS